MANVMKLRRLSAIGVVVFLVLAGLASADEPIYYPDDHYPLQVAKLPVAEQDFLYAVTPYANEMYSTLFGPAGVFAPGSESPSHYWLYRHTNQAMGWDKEGSNSPEAFCDENQTQYCRYLVTTGKVWEQETYVAIIESLRQARAWHDYALTHGATVYTRYTPVGTDDLPPELRHVFALFCERPYDERRFALYDMGQVLDNMRVALKPEYKAQILGHIQNGETLIPLEGGGYQKIHPLGVHKDCDLS